MDPTESFGSMRIRIHNTEMVHTLHYIQNTCLEITSLLLPILILSWFQLSLIVISSSYHKSIMLLRFACIMILCAVFMITFLWNYENNVKVILQYCRITGLSYLDNITILYCIDDVIMIWYQRYQVCRVSYLKIMTTTGSFLS
jgi:hypothetical protein